MEPFIGEIKMFAGNFAPRGWALCDGQLLPISSNQALFSILGTTYGGNGIQTFGLPDLRGRVPLHPGNGPGLSHHSLGEKTGQESVTLTSAQLPSHSHALSISNGGPTTKEAGYLATGGIYNAGPPNAAAPANTIQASGGSQPVAVAQPSLAVNFIIALQGIYPSRG